MSSEMEGIGVIAAAVVLGPAALGIAALGAAAAGAAGVGWLALQAGQLVVGANEAVNDSIRQQQIRAREEEKQRRQSALSGHEQLVQMCRGAMTQLDQLGVQDASEVARLKYELQEICAQPLPNDTQRLESLTAMGMSKLQRIMDRHERMNQLRMDEGEYRGLALADLMADLRISVEAARIVRCEGKDVQAADPKALERAELNKRLTNVTGRVMAALEFVVDLGSNYGISEANQAWFESCFGGVDQRIKELCAPTVTNERLKKGIKSLEEMMHLYETLRPALEKEKNAISALYPHYRQAAEALGEDVLPMRHFKSAEALEQELQRLAERTKKAQQCADIYARLGPAAYMCYAWDQELQAMGYAVRQRSEIAQMADHKPQRAKKGEVKLPFYQWSGEDMTQIYDMDGECDLQLIVHPDGTVTMETIARDSDRSRVQERQKTHCRDMKELHRRLKENWFILYDYEETKDASHVQSLHAWRNAEDNRWTQAAQSGSTVGQREQKREQKHTKTMQQS